MNHPEFKKMMSNIKPGYKPSNGHDKGCRLLNKVTESVIQTYEDDLRGQTVSEMLVVASEIF